MFGWFRWEWGIVLGVVGVSFVLCLVMVVKYCFVLECCLVFGVVLDDGLGMVGVFVM